MNTPKPPVQPRYSPEQAHLAAFAQLKQQMNDAVIGLIFDDVLYDMQETLRGIIDDNNLLLKASHRSVLYKGKYYNLEDHPADYPTELDPQLNQRMNDYLAEHKQVREYEIPVIQGILKSMFVASDRVSDYKQILPEAVHRAFDFFYNVPTPRRTMKPEGIAKFQKRIAPYISVMKGRMLHNRLTGRGNTP